MGRKPIQDQFSGLGVSRQRKYQLRRIALGLCILCGKRKIMTRQRCLTCNQNERGIIKTGTKPFGRTA